MKFEVRATPTALADAAAVANQIGAAGFPLNAERWVADLLDVLARLDTLPGGCPIAPEDGEIPDCEIRQCLFGKYRILLTIRGRTVFVLHIRWGGRLPATRDDLAAVAAEMMRMP